MECHLYDPREYCLWNNRKEWHSDGSGDDTMMRAGTWATVMRAGMAQWWKHRPLHYWWEQGWQSNRSRDGTMMRAGMARWWEKGWHSDECRDGTVVRAGTMANPCNPAMSPHAEKGSRSQSHWINGGKSGKGVAVSPNHVASSCSKHVQECLNQRAHGILTCAHMQRPLNTTDPLSCQLC